jgi:hypothetical protein
VEISPSNTLHVVDDTPSFRRAVKRALTASWDDTNRSDNNRPAFRDWDFVWELTKALESKDAEVVAGDIVVTDLYPSGFWAKVKDLPGTPSVTPITEPLPGDPTNMYRAGLDVRKRFLPTLTAHGLAVVVLTFLPRYIERINPDRTPLTSEQLRELADKLRKALTEETWTLVEKHNRTVSDACNVEEMTLVVNALMDGGN